MAVGLLCGIALNTLKLEVLGYLCKSSFSAFDDARCYVTQ